MILSFQVLELLSRGVQFDSISKLALETKVSVYLIRKTLKELQHTNLVRRNKNQFIVTVWGMRLLNSQNSNFAVTLFENL